MLEDAKNCVGDRGVEGTYFDPYAIRRRGHGLGASVVEMTERPWCGVHDMPMGAAEAGAGHQTMDCDGIVTAFVGVVE